MSKYLALSTAFVAATAKVGTFEALRAVLKAQMPEFTFAVTFSANQTMAFINPPAGMGTVKPVFVVADNDKELVTKIIGAVPRILYDLAQLEAKPVVGQYEHVLVDRKAVAREQRKIIKDRAAKAVIADGVVQQ